MKITRLFDILPHIIKTYPEQEVALAGKNNGEWKKYNIHEYIDKANSISYGLMHLGIQKGEKIALIANNRPEWNMLDMGIMQTGAIPVPVYPTISEEDYNYILNHSEAGYLFVEENLLFKLKNVLPHVPSLKQVYTFAESEDYKPLQELIDLGKNNPDETQLKTRKDNIQPTDVACMIYTSGTTNNPKGVMLSHQNIIYQLINLEQTPSKWSKTAFSFLPLSHAYEKMIVYLYQYLGMSVYYAENIGTIAEDLKAVNPTMMTCVPRILEKIYDKLWHAGKKLPFFQRKLYYWAFNLANHYQLKGLSKLYTLKHNIADKLIYRKWRENIGGNFDIVVSGSAAIQPAIAAFFSAIGMPVFEGYGLTETSPVIAVSNRDTNGRRFGTVGPPLHGVEVKIADKDEIICRGHNVMLGYYKEPELTKEVIDPDGWFHTGDTGHFTDEGQLIITGRLKTIFKTSFGKYVNPQLIEDKFTQSPFIENMIVLGENQKFAAALILPDFTSLKKWAVTNKVQYNTNKEAIENPEIKKLFDNIVKEYNTYFGDTEKVKKHKLISDEWTQENGILTPTLKIKRRIILDKYKNEIDALFD